MDGDKKVYFLLLGIALFLLGLGGLVTDLFPIGRGSGWFSGFTARILSVIVLIMGAISVYAGIKDIGRSTRPSLLGEPVSPEEGLMKLAKFYDETGKTEESLKTLATLYELQNKYEELQTVQVQLRNLQAKKK